MEFFKLPKEFFEDLAWEIDNSIDNIKSRVKETPLYDMTMLKICWSL